MHKEHAKIVKNRHIQRQIYRKITCSKPSNQTNETMLMPLEDYIPQLVHIRQLCPMVSWRIILVKYMMIDLKCNLVNKNVM